ncbi:hypothetical protein G5I_00449 [Acromyrmex echinatior]|uniref:Uncharacterized protein n=1 Tax=Acromyrmex echinatior TaxID=103372 RepID=F4W4W7_ACREC|nr:hypothetical protein G5I_00449 [Acromyrmex echinatior]
MSQKEEAERRRERVPGGRGPHPPPPGDGGVEGGGDARVGGVGGQRGRRLQLSRSRVRAWDRPTGREQRRPPPPIPEVTEEEEDEEENFHTSLLNSTPVDCKEINNRISLRNATQFCQRELKEKSSTLGKIKLPRVGIPAKNDNHQNDSCLL